ncbi:MAG: hypothetical protein HY746_04220 [Elusimicrobia bacterium]|nr:hypothetical protein [Elusimicrobiota bacterium]
MNKIITNENIKKVNLKLKGNSEVLFESSEDTFEIKKLEYSGYNENPVVIDTSKKTIDLTQKRAGSFLKNTDSDSLVKYHILIPKRKEINIEVDKSRFSGNIEASEIKINAGNLIADNFIINSESYVNMCFGFGRISGRIETAKEVKITAGNISGELDIIETADIKNISGLSKLKIYRIKETR